MDIEEKLMTSVHTQCPADTYYSLVATLGIIYTHTLKRWVDVEYTECHPLHKLERKYLQKEMQWV